jgi:hypothetical protein
VDLFSSMPSGLSQLVYFLHVSQISLNKSIILQCTTVSFTLPLYPQGFAILC